ncbi:response regulator [Longimicrobium sp.]|uniref:response regulator n=1 Tax=Longimicrobium sp. TaxID=2029185 RepID=UPI002E31FB4F|nr:response regulator [Longimicrobium sp.]HEX6036961.1 response regulator [Longimicrobium sp.]
MQYAGAPLIALADDDDAHADVVCAWLEALGYRMTRFPTGDALLEWAASSPEVPAAVLLDVEMPGRDGFAVCAELRRMAAYAHLPCVLVSSLPAATLEDGARVSGGSGSMRKDASLLPRLAEWVMDAIPLPSSADASALEAA